MLHGPVLCSAALALLTYGCLSCTVLGSGICGILSHVLHGPVLRSLARAILTYGCLPCTVLWSGLSFTDLGAMSVCKLLCFHTPPEALTRLRIVRGQT